MKIAQVLFWGCSSIEELLFSLFSTMWISGDLSFYLWLRYAEIAIGLFVGSISVSRLVLLCIFSIKVILETLRREDTQRNCKIYFINISSVYFLLKVVI